MSRNTKPFKIIFIFFIAACLFIIQKAFSNEAGPGAGYTGAPGENDCTSCHSGTPVTNSNAIKVFTNMANGQYIPDSVYHFMIRGYKQSCTKFGFQCTMINGSGNKLGTLTVPTAATRVQILTGTKDYMEHTATGTTALYNDSTDWLFDWKAPSSLSGDASLFIAMNASNNDNNSTGDEIHLKDFTYPQTSNAPVASITTNVNTICQGDSVFFSASGTNGTSSYQWSFPGGIPDTGNAQSLWVKFPASGSEVCSLRVANSIMHSSWVTKTITVNGRPVATINYNNSALLCDGDSLALTATFNTAFTYQWQKNGTNINGATGNSIFVKTSGTYRVIVTSIQGCSIITSPVIINVNSKPAAVLSAPFGTSTCQGDTIILTASGGSGYSYYWYRDNILNGQTIDSFYNATASGRWTVKIFSSVGCSSSSNAVNLNFFVSPNVNIVSVADSVCIGDSIDLMAISFDTVLRFQWLYNGAIIPGATRPDQYAAATGDYSVEVTTNRGCKKISPIKYIKIVALPPPNDLDSVRTSCAYNLSVRQTGYFEYQWYRNDSLFNVTDTMIVASQTGKYYVRVYNSAGCFSTTNSIFLTIPDAPDVNITPLNNAVICSDSSIIYSVPFSSNSLYQWYKNGNPVSGAAGNSLMIKDSGSYFVKVTKGTCELQSATRNVKVNYLPNNVISKTDSSFCHGDSVMLSTVSSAGLSYQWYNGISPVANSNIYFIYVKTPGAYSVKIAKGSCSNTSALVNITERPLPPVPLITQKGDTLSATSASLYQWMKGGSAIPGANSRTYIISTSGSYSVLITDSNGCKNISQDFFVIASGIKQSDRAGIISVYPNPVSGKLTISFPYAAERSLTILDATGKKIAMKDIKENAAVIDFSDFAPAVYFVRVISEGNEIPGMIRVVKK
jgi:hypothetical protein